MQISQLFLRNFGKFENFNCDFSPGLNLIKGANETGKSTLVEAISTALFANPQNNIENSAKVVRWNSPDSPSVMAMLNIDGNSYKLIKDFNNGMMELIGEGQDGEKIDDIDGWLVEKTGMPSEEIFRATACINQGEITHIENSIGAIQGKLESLVTGGREDQAASMIIDKIESRIQEISGDDGGPGKELERLYRLIEEVDYNIEKLSRDIANLRSKRSDLIQVEVAYRNVLEDLSAKKQKIESVKKASKIQDDIEVFTKELKELESKLHDAQDAIRRMKELKSRLTELKKVEARDLKLLEDLEAEIRYYQPQKREMENDLKESTDELEEYHIGGAYFLIAGIGSLGFAASIASLFLRAMSFIAPYAKYSATISFALAGIGWAVVNARKSHKKYLSEKADKVKLKFEELQKDIDEKTGRMKGLLSKYSSATVDDLKRNLWQFEESEKQHRREKEIYDSLMGGGSPQDMEQRFSYLQQQLKMLHAEREILEANPMDDAEINRQELVINQFEERIKDLERERTVFQQHISTVEGGAELLASYMERKDELNAKAEELKREVAILKLTASCINEARQNVLISTLEVLNNKTSEILDKLTSGRYRNVRFDKSNLKFEVYLENKKEWIDPESVLSTGTVDQIYLAARLALAEIISGDKKSMMILDDPFANYDEDRIENAMKIIKELSADHQILLLTSQNHYDKWADALITL